MLTRLRAKRCPRPVLLGLCGLAVFLLAGCGGSTGTSTTSPKKSSGAEEVATKDAAGSDSANPGSGFTADDSAAGSSSGATPRKFAPIKLGSSSGDSGTNGAGGGEKQLGTVLEAMQPLQVVLGQWRGVTRKKFSGVAKVEDPQWVWDFQTNRERPALTFASDAHHYFKSGRMTFLLDKQKFQLTATDKDDVERIYEGEFTTPVQDVPGDDKKLQRTFKLTLTQVAPTDDRKLVQVVFAQQENNRYLMEVYDKRGDDVLLVDTVANQREGTSFAINPDDYGDKACVVSGGLGTTAVSHNGKTYYVCCSGCAAAFKDEPERWIAKFEALKTKMP